MVLVLIIVTVRVAMLHSKNIRIMIMPGEITLMVPVMIHYQWLFNSYNQCKTDFTFIIMLILVTEVVGNGYSMVKHQGTKHQGN